MVYSEKYLLYSHSLQVVTLLKNKLQTIFLEMRFENFGKYLKKLSNGVLSKLQAYKLQHSALRVFKIQKQKQSLTGSLQRSCSKQLFAKISGGTTSVL